MQLKNFAAVMTALFLTLMFVQPLAAQQNVQEEEVSADLEDPIDTAETEFVSKGAVAYAYAPLTESVLNERLSYLTSCVDLRSTGVVKGYIRTYTNHKPEKARGMLGRRLTYFPLFEQKLREYGLPEDLKYLSVVESALNAKAVSRVGATGLWQFMPTTGSDYGMRTNSAVEDRSNPVKSTDAACRYLRDLYKDFGDWALALAAYNSGPNRVNSAIRRAGSRDFWRIMRYLPNETRNYVPAFIAATYICNYYNEHGLRPVDPDMDEQLTSYILVHEGISFRDISEATGVSYAMIKNLNPGFRRDYIPPTNDGHYVIVPQRVMPAFVRYLNSVSSVRKYTWNNPEASTGISEMGDGRYYQTQMTVGQAEHVDKFASRMGLCGDHLRAWNKLNNNFVYANQNLVVMHPVYVQKHSGGIKVEGIGASKTKVNPTIKENTTNNSKPAAPTGTNKPVAAPARTEPNIESLRRQTPSDGARYQFHTVRRNESLQDIARQYATSIESLRKLNGDAINDVKFGARLKIREY